MRCVTQGRTVIATGSGLVAWRRPTLPRLKTQYHGRGGVSRPSSGWDRVYQPRYRHQATGPDLVMVTDGVRMVVCCVCEVFAYWCCVR